MFGVTTCRVLEPAIFRLWGKGVSTRPVRMDQFTHNLRLVLCDSTLYRRYKRKKKYDLQKGGWKKYGRISGASLTNLIITGSYASGIV